MPVEPLVVKGLLPGRGPAGRPAGLDPAGLAGAGFGAAAAGLAGAGLAPGRGPGADGPPPVAGLGAPERGGAVSPVPVPALVGWVNSGAAGPGLTAGFGVTPGVAGLGAAPLGLGAATPGLGAGGRGDMAPGLGAPGLGAPPGTPGLAAFLPPLPLNASVSFRTTGASIVEDAERTNSPSSWSLAMTTLLSTPSSLASSYTRTLATSLL